ncbi:hypothetical protein BLOT_008460 [Blomia tropicalis]|nr:hypothetical protein BLOT_008460 [Blomia tropicalis]
MKKYYNKRNATRCDDIQVGSNILVVHKKKLSSKLDAKSKGPFLVIEQLGPVTYLVKDSENKTMKVHRDQMLKTDLDQLSLIRGRGRPFKGGYQFFSPKANGRIE